MGEILAFVSGKGGTGKTSMCAAVASCLAAMGDSVLCVDMDMGLRNLDLALAMDPEPLLPFTSILDGTYSLDQLQGYGPLAGLCLLSAPVTVSAEQVDPGAMKAFLDGCRQRFDWCLLDAPAGVGAGFRLCTENADRILLVTGGDRAALRDGAGAARLFPEKTPALVLVNRVDRRFFRAAGETIDDVMDTVGLPLAGIVPEDPTVSRSAAQGTPLVLAERKGAAAAALRVARRLKGLKAPLGIR